MRIVGHFEGQEKQMQRNVDLALVQICGKEIGLQLFAELMESTSPGGKHGFNTHRSLGI